MARTMPFAPAARTARATRQPTAVSGPSPAPWALILAGGDGVRLRPLTQQITGDERRKQFCALLSDDTLWAETFGRAARSVSPSRILTVVTETHASFYGALLRTTWPRRASEKA
jgi:mannose-1-phosphate guanylyltransferase